jgi:hypothetical protein
MAVVIAGPTRLANEQQWIGENESSEGYDWRSEERES